MNATRAKGWEGWCGHGLLLAVSLSVLALGLDLERTMHRWRPAGVAGGEPLLTVSALRPEVGQDGLSLAQIDRLREVGPLARGAAVGLQELELACAGHAAGLRQTALAGPGLFSLLGLVPALGSARDLTAGAGAVVSHRFWMAHCGGRPDVIGQRLAVQGLEVSWPIVAVLPEGFDGLDPDEPTAAWVPAADFSRLMKVSMPGLDGPALADLARALARRTPAFAWVFPRPRGFDPALLQQVLDRQDLELAPQVRAAGMKVTLTGTGGAVRPRLYEGIVLRPERHERLLGYLALARACALLLLVLTAVNLGLYWLGGLGDRAQHWRICHVLGASPARLVLGHAAGAVALLGGVAVLAVVLLAVFRALLRGIAPFAGFLHAAPALPPLASLSPVAGVAGLLVVAAVALPAWFLRAPLRPASGGILGEARQERVWKSALAAGQTGFAAFLLVLAAALVLQLFDQAWRQWEGRDRVRMVRVSCGGAGQACGGLDLDVAELLGARLGPAAWAHSSELPMLPGRWRRRYILAGNARPGATAAGGVHAAAVNRVDPAFFRIMGLRVLAGALPEPGATAAVVNAAFCRRHALAPGECPGLALRWAEGGGGVQVAAVVEDLRYRHPGTPAEPMIYLDASAAPGRGASAVVAGRGSPAVLRRYLERGLAARGRGQAVVQVYRLGEEIARTTRQERRAAMAAAAVAGYAALVALAGVYLRMRERVARGMPGIALRMAVGAPWGAVARELALRPMLLLTVALAAAVPGVALLGPALPQVVRPQSAYLPAAGAAVTVALGLAQATVLALSLRRLRRVRLAALLADS